MSGFLASVDNLEDAIKVNQLGADIIDLKDPKQGAWVVSIANSLLKLSISYGRVQWLARPLET